MPVTVAATDLGPALIGVFLNVLLHGCMGLQCCIYFNHNQKDALWMKVLVGVLLFAETLNTAFDMWWVYDVFVLHFMDPSALGVANWIFATDPAMVGIISTICQMFFAWRIKVLTNNTLLVWFIRITALGSITGGVGTAIAVRYVPSFLEFQRFKELLIIWFTTSVVCDTAIATTLTMFMTRHKTGIIGTDQIMHKLTRLTITNGLLVTIVALANLVAFLASNTGVYLLFNFPLAKLYTNSLMSTLNSRIASQDILSNSQRRVSELTPPSRIEFGRPPVQPLAIDKPLEAHEMADPKRHVEWSPTLHQFRSRGSTEESAV